MKLAILVSVLVAASGCVKQPGTRADGFIPVSEYKSAPVATDAQGYPQLPAVRDNLQPPMVQVLPPVLRAASDPSEVPCGHEMTIKVGKLDVSMPHGGKLEIAGVKGQTDAYHIILENVEFSNAEHCLQ